MVSKPHKCICNNNNKTINVPQYRLVQMLQSLPHCSGEAQSTEVPAIIDAELPQITDKNFKKLPDQDKAGQESV